MPGEGNSAIALETTAGVPITYLSTLAGWEARGPWIRVEGTRGTAHWDFRGPCRIEFAEGSEQVIEPDGRREHNEVFRNAIRCLRGVDDELNCPVAMTRPLTVAVNGAYESGAPQRAALTRDTSPARTATARSSPASTASRTCWTAATASA